MKKYIYLLTIVVVILILPIRISALDDTDKYIDEFKSVLPEEYSQISLDPSGLIETASLKGLLLEIVSISSGHGGRILSFFLILVGSLVLLSLSYHCPDTVKGAVSTSVGCIASLLIFNRISAVYDEITTSVSSVFDFFGAIIPITTAVTAMGGGVNAATVQGGGMYITLSVIGGVFSFVTSILSAFCLAMSLLSAFGNDGAGAILRGVKSFFMWFIGIMTALITGTIALQTVIASAADSGVMRTMKYMAAGLIPIVGSTVSSALSTLAAGLSYVKGIIGGGAILVIVLLLLSPIVMLVLHRLAFSVCIIISDFVGASTASKIFSSFRFSLDTLIVLSAVSSVILILEIVLFMKVGVALL